MKPPVGSFPDPTTGQEVATKAFLEGLTRQTASGDYITAYMSAADNDVTVGTPLALDSISQQRGGLGLSSNQITGLKAGRTYLLVGQFRIDGSSPTGSVDISWYDVTAASTVGTAASMVSAANATNFSQGSVCQHLFTPTVDTTLEVRPTFVSPAGMDISGGLSQSFASVIEVGAVAIDAASGTEYLDRIVVTGSAVQSVTFGTGGDGELGRALDGDVDEHYFLVSRIFNAAAPSNGEFTIRPNAASTGLSGQKLTSNGGTAPSSQDIASSWPIGNFTSEEFGVTAEVFAKSGLIRRGTASGSAGYSGSGDPTIHLYAGTWDDNATNITSLQIYATSGVHIGVGSEFILYRRTATSLRADSASLYERNVEAVVAQGTNAATAYATGHATYAGSALGVSASLIDDTVTSGSITVDFKIGGSTVLTATLDSTNTSFHRAAAQLGAHTVSPGDAVEVDVSTTSLVTTGGGSPGLVVNVTLSNDAYAKVPSGPAYMYARLTADQTTNISAGNHVEFDVESSRGTLISLATGAGQADGIFTLAPGVTYEIVVAMRMELNEGAFNAQLYDDVGETAIVDDTGEDAAVLVGYDNIANDASQVGTNTVIFTPSVETDVKMEITAATNPVRVYAAHSFILIKELR